EQGIIVPVGIQKLQQHLPDILEEGDNALSWGCTPDNGIRLNPYRSIKRIPSCSGFHRFPWVVSPWSYPLYHSCHKCDKRVIK
ncbi:hypothetical protein, partial [Xenorhabdus bovienii]|uniref:hypothetical protein n=1 Tax=Xenorhabdus bovienii TaxID=40576 RepID=UPI0023B3053C